MKRPTLLPVMALLMIFSFTSCSTDAIDEDKIDAIASSYVPQTKSIEIEILELINDHRISKGLDVLENMSAIKAEAFGHTDYMIDKSEVSHDNFFRRKANLVDKVDAIAVGENVAYAYNSPESVVNAWLNSDGHRHVIEGDYTDFDISAEKDVDGRWYFTNIFVRK